MFALELDDRITMPALSPHVVLLHCSVTPQALSILRIFTLPEVVRVSSVSTVRYSLLPMRQDPPTWVLLLAP
ncbi:MAG: hypothetical protein HY899_19630 [Deltaproteobacteria bacterium]|nr:hypothetical protein [Deltaproteobacteria bacterium]